MVWAALRVHGDTPDTSVWAANCTIEDSIALIDFQAGKTYRRKLGYLSLQTIP
jgi:hypothetical protein